MIKHLLKLSTLSLLILLVFTSCSDSDDHVAVPKGDFENGYFVSNEGNFGSPNGSVTFIDNSLIEKTENVFQSINSTTLGDVFNSMTIDGGLIYLVVNNSNKIEVVNRYTFESVATITEKIDQPRYAVVENGKLYVTNSRTKSVEVFDAETFEHMNTIVIDRAVEEIKEDNNFIYVMNAAFGTGSDISVINVDTNAIVKTITVGDGLNSMEIEDGILYALHETGITKITTSNNEIIGEIPFTEGLENASKLEIEDNFIYFVSGSKIFKFNKSVTSLANTELVDTQVTAESWFIGYGFNVVGNKMFYTDVKGFTENSEVKVYDLDGKFLKSFTAGMGANGVYGND